MFLDKTIDFLGNLPLFSSLDRKDLQAVALMCRERKLNKGELVFQEGDDADRIFLVKEGTIKIFRQSLSGKNITLRLETKGGLVGELAMFGATPYPGSCQALGEAKIFEIARRDFLSFIEKNPALISRFIALFISRLRGAYNVINDLGIKSLSQRLAGMLLSLSGSIGQSGHKGYVTLSTIISRHDLADMVGATPESVCRLMAEMRRKGIIDYSQRRIVILDFDRLKAIAHETEE